MKNILVLGSVLALAACCFTPEEVAQHDEYFAQFGCERVDRKKIHLVYKCPSNVEWLNTLKQQEPTHKFFQNGSLNWEEVNADAEHIYVEVVNVKGGACEEIFHYRVMIRPLDKETKQPYAVLVCATSEENK